jgi:dephospho-CoA kinase
LLKIGLTGGIASGKSTVCALFETFSVPIIDADTIALQLVEPNMPAHSEIVLKFGKEILNIDNRLNRKKMRQLIFSDPSAKHSLEDILHPKIRQQLILQTHQYHAPYIILAIPLLFEAKMTDLVDRTLVIDIHDDLQLERLQQRDKIPAQQAQAMIKAQCSQQQRLASADDIIDNNNDITSLKSQVELLHKKYIKLANDRPTHGQ